MSGTVLDLSGVASPAGGDVTDGATQAQVISAQAIDEAAQGITTHEGTAQAPFQFSYNGATLSFTMFQNFIADAGLYAAINAAPDAAAAVTWNN